MINHSKNIIRKTTFLTLINIIIFIGLIVASIFFEFLVLGWGASANSPDFSFDLTSIAQLLILFYLAVKKRSKPLWIAIFVISYLYLILKMAYHFN